MFYIFRRQIGWLSLQQLRLSVEFSGPGVLIGQFDLALFRKKDVLWSHVSESGLLANDIGDFFFGCANGIKKMPKFRLREAGSFISEKFDGIIENEWIIIVSDLNMRCVTVTLRRLVQAAHFSKLLSFRGSSRKRYFLGSILCDPIEECHFSYDRYSVCISIYRTLAELVETSFDRPKRGWFTWIYCYYRPRL